MNWLQRHIKNITLVFAIAIIIGIIAFAIIVVHPIQFANFPLIRETTLVIATSLTAIATLILAYATFGIISSSREQENRRREDEIAKEKRNRNIGLLDEMISWAESVSNIGFTAEIRFPDKIIDFEPITFFIQFIDRRLIMCNEAFSRVMYFRTVSTKISLFSEELPPAIIKIESAVKTMTDMLEKSRKDFAKTDMSVENMQPFQNIILKQQENIQHATEELVKKATSIKLSIMGMSN